MWLELSTRVHCLPTWVCSREDGGKGRRGQVVRAGPHHECSCNLTVTSSSLCLFPGASPMDGGGPPCRGCFLWFPALRVILSPWL